MMKSALRDEILNNTAQLILEFQRSVRDGKTQTIFLTNSQWAVLHTIIGNGKIPALIYFVAVFEGTTQNQSGFNAAVRNDAEDFARLDFQKRRTSVLSHRLFRKSDLTPG